jgi:iron complex outermembrane receptor protein
MFTVLQSRILEAGPERRPGGSGGPGFPEIPPPSRPFPGTCRAAFLLTVLASVGATPEAVVGQVSNPPDPVAPGRAAPADTLPLYALDSLTVSVLRTPLSALRAPAAVAVLGQESLRPAKRGMYLEEALQGLPGVQVQNRFNDAVGERVMVRGFGARSQFGIRSVKILVDGIPATLPDGQSTLDHLDLGSLGRVEALRGPGSSLYGNAAGGVLLFRTQAPSSSRVDAEAGAMAGSWGSRQIRGLASGSGPRLGYVASATHTTYDGYRANPLDSGPETYGASTRSRGNLVLSFPLLGGEIRTVATLVDLDAENPGSLNDSLLALGTREAYRFNVLRQTGKEVTQGQAGATWTGELAGLEGEGAIWGVSRSVDTTLPTSVVTLDRGVLGFRGQLGRSFFRGDRLHLAGGVDVERQSDDRRNFTNEEGRPGDKTLDQGESVSALAGFLQGEWRPRDDITAVGGIRYDRLSFDVDDRFAESGEASGSRTLDSFSPSLGISWTFAEGIGVYGNLSTFFETPTTSELANRPDGATGFNPDLEPARGHSMEAGLRGGLPGSLGWEVVGFWTYTRDELVPFEVPSDPGRTYYRNAGESSRRGAEVLGWVQPHPALTVRGVYSYTDARFEEYEVGDESFDGNPIPGLAPHRLEVVPELRTERGFFGSLAMIWTDDVPVDDGNTAAPAASHTVLDLRGGWDAVPLGPIHVDVFGGITNLLDEEYVSSVVVNAFGGRYYEPGPRRGFYLGGSVSFGR